MQKHVKRYGSVIISAISLIALGIFISFVGYELGSLEWMPGLLVYGTQNAGLLICVAGIIYFFFNRIQSSLEQFNPLQEDIKELRQRVKDEPEKVEPLWELGRAKLELYFNRNLSQINSIFWLSVIVMIVGFGFILYGISQTFAPASAHTPGTITPAIVGSVAGVITEFIGATFLFIYRSTVQQAAGYIKTLERINSVGMAMKILDTISIESKELQDKTKAEMVRMLLSESGNSPVKDPNTAKTPEKYGVVVKKAQQ